MRRATIRKTLGQWRAVRPGYGFGRDTTTTHATWRDAMNAVKPRPCADSVQTETTYTAEDGLSTVPRWSPMWPLSPDFLDHRGQR